MIIWMSTTLFDDHLDEYKSDDHLDEYKFDDHLDEYKFDHCRYSVLSLSVTFTGCFVDSRNLDHRTVGLEFSTETTLHLARLWAVSRTPDLSVLTCC